MPENAYRPERRVAGTHDIRLDGIGDLLSRARGARVLDVGANRGLVGLDFARHGAVLVHGCDIYSAGMETARKLFEAHEENRVLTAKVLGEAFADNRACEYQFEVTNLTHGSSAFAIFGGARYDIVLLLAVVHKLRRIMAEPDVRDLVRFFGNMTDKYIGWRGPGNDNAGAKEEMGLLDKWLDHVGLKRIQTSWIAQEKMGPAAIWQKG